MRNYINIVLHFSKNICRQIYNTIKGIIRTKLHARTIVLKNTNILEFLIILELHKQTKCFIQHHRIGYNTKSKILSYIVSNIEFQFNLLIIASY